MEIEVGEYVRTKKGDISKVRYVDEENIFLEDSVWSKNDLYEKTDVLYFDDEEIAKHSKNIIDLIDVGDYVNGCLIVKIYKDPFIEGQINLWTNMLFPNKYYKEKITDKNIKAIVTKEQFYNKEYRL